MNKYALREDKKAARQAAILDAVSKENVSTQNELVAALARRGIAATQVSLSRDIAELGLIKAGGCYKPAPAQGAADPELALRTSVRRAQAAGPHMVVAVCDSGAAQRVAFVLDRQAPPGLVGTLAGDDTVFIAVESAAANKRMLEFLRSRMKAS